MDSTGTTYEIVRFAIDTSKPSVIFQTNWYLLIGLLIISVILFLLGKKAFLQKFRIYDLEVEISGSPKASFKVQRNDDNIYIANRIYIELITRKAAMPVDEDNDVILEVYNSWYTLFGVIRDEIKTIPARYLRAHDPSGELLGLTVKILNDGLRPHLTRYQARFRKWYAEELQKAENKQVSPQDLQKKFPEYALLMAELKKVNQVLIGYAGQLHKLITGKE